MISITVVTGLLASFARCVSRGNSGSVLAKTLPAIRLFATPHARQATLHTASFPQGEKSPQCRFHPEPYQAVTQKGSSAKHKNRSPQRVERCLHAIEDRPIRRRGKAPPPSTHPNLGRASKHQRFHRCALQRIFRPFFKTGRPD